MKTIKNILKTGVLIGLTGLVGAGCSKFKEEIVYLDKKIDNNYTIMYTKQIIDNDFDTYTLTMKDSTGSEIINIRSPDNYQFKIRNDEYSTIVNDAVEGGKGLHIEYANEGEQK